MPYSDPRMYMIHRHIAEYGISIQAIHPRPGDENQHSFIYTVGMARLGAPELICFGLGPKHVMPYFNTIFDEIRRKVRRPGMSRDDDTWTFVTYFDDVETSKVAQYATATFEFYEGTGITPTFKQMVFPDKRGFYPWEAQCSDDIKALQPYLGTRKRRDADHDQSLALN